MKAILYPTRYVATALLVAIAACFHATAFSQQAKKKGTSVGEPPADHSPEAELASFQVLDGFAVNLFASEADGVTNPLVLRWDERGRLWVICTTSYPQPAPGEVCNDRILVLEDTDHDGRADKFTTFADGLRMPTGMELGAPGELYVGEGEKLWRFLDTDGDDRMDRKEVVFSGFGTGDTHQNINSFIWSPDGCLIMHQGLHCYSRVSTPWGVKQLYGSGYWRYWPRSARLEPYPTGMPANAWGTAFDKNGQPFMVAGAAGMFWARPMEVSVPEIENGGAQPYFLLTRFMLPHSGQIIKTEGLRKFCGVDFVGNSHWPAEMQGEMITGGFFENAVYRHKIVDDAESPSGFEALEQTPLIKSDNVAFRIVDVRFGPEGALYLADWYNPIIGHYQASFRHPDRDKQHGRIWRMTARNGKPAQPGDLASLDVTALIAKTADPDRWTAYQASRLLKGKGLQEIKDAVVRLEKETNGAAQSATRLLSVHEQFEWVDESAVKPLLASDNADARAYATHTVGNWAERLPAPLALLESRIVDESPRVRLEAIVALAKVRDAESIQIALRALDKPMDTFLDRALWLAVHALAPDWKPMLNPPEGAPSLLDSLPPRHLAYLVEKEGSEELLHVARALVKKSGTDLAPDLRRSLLDVLVRKGPATDWALALRLASKDPQVLDSLAEAAQLRRYKPPAEAAEVLAAVLNAAARNPSTPGAVSAARLAGAWKLPLTEPLRALLKPSSFDANGNAISLRAEVVRALGSLGGNADEVASIAASQNEDPAVRAAALQALVSLDPARAGRTAGSSMSSIGDPDAMRRFLAPILPVPAANGALATLLQKEPCSTDAAKLAIRALTSAGRSDPELSAVLYQILGMGGGVPQFSQDWVNTLAGEIKASGEPERGRAVFSSILSNCTACHRVGGQGGVIGPELDAVGRGVPLELLIEAVVWPNRQIKEGYVATTVVMKDGRTLQGYKVREGNGELELRDFLTGQVNHLPNSQMQSRQEAGSLMPEGLVMGMTRAELRDLIAYLSTLGR